MASEFDEIKQLLENVRLATGEHAGIVDIVVSGEIVQAGAAQEQNDRSVAHEKARRQKNPRATRQLQCPSDFGRRARTACLNHVS